jgi:hypothetical protein
MSAARGSFEGLDRKGLVMHPHPATVWRRDSPNISQAKLLRNASSLAKSGPSQSVKQPAKLKAPASLEALR